MVVVSGPGMDALKKLDNHCYLLTSYIGVLHQVFGFVILSSQVGAVRVGTVPAFYGKDC